MADNLTLGLDTIGGGSVMDDFDAALRSVQRGLQDADLLRKPRKIVVEVTLTPKDDGFVNIEHCVKVTLPARQRTAVAWHENGELVTRDDLKGARRGTGDDPRQTHMALDEDEPPRGRSSRQ